MTGWWFSPPIWKNMFVKLDYFPKFWGEHKKCCHHQKDDEIASKWKPQKVRKPHTNSVHHRKSINPMCHESVRSLVLNVGFWWQVIPQKTSRLFTITTIAPRGKKQVNLCFCWDVFEDAKTVRQPQITTAKRGSPKSFGHQASALWLVAPLLKAK